MQLEGALDNAEAIVRRVDVSEVRVGGGGYGKVGAVGGGVEAADKRSDRVTREQTVRHWECLLAEKRKEADRTKNKTKHPINTRISIAEEKEVA